METPVALAQFVGPAIYEHVRGDVAMHEGTFAAGLVLPCHVHDAPVISLVLEGVGVEEVDGRTRAVAAQHLLLTPSYAPHGYRFGSAGRWFNIQLSDRWLARVVDGGPRLPVTAQVVRSRAAAAWVARVRAEVRERDAISTLAIDGALVLMVADLVRLRVDGAVTRPRWLHRVEDAIEASVAAPPPVDELAALAGVHPTHLLRTFRRHHGTTVANYVRQRRIERARAAVAKGDRSLSMIALDAGFADQSHFTRVFRQAFGETPGQYARALRGR
ncbi:Helix-turn-helix, AraC domain-containing protein [Gemmatirosa kalamazoonensis]|uniref:Helix-turn-helix, AraC domain-containing protein n=1 Tax=Gemmatirosa kalamazoonensis TaxID=861299 RepID=W0RGC9_9BACT|nr:AraC family transcriptional regulator [Gemmatirosa kalamazoonensis]AHG89385.1 Helix-turn-helix, AraC domain-containing protein [Gemmatirosa kalamazoonensis]